MGNLYQTSVASRIRDMFTEPNCLIPARLDATQTAGLLGFQEHDIPVLVYHRMLEPLGKPAPNSRKYFARIQIMVLADNPAWLSKATNLLYQHWHIKNANRSKDESGVELAVAA